MIQETIVKMPWNGIVHNVAKSCRSHHLQPMHNNATSEAAQCNQTLRSDLHRLFDKGLLSVDPDERRILVSTRLKDEFDNGEQYRLLQGKGIAIPSNQLAIPSKEHLLYHAACVSVEERNHEKEAKQEILPAGCGYRPGVWLCPG